MRVEIFDINEPDIIFKCKYPMQLVGETVNDPLTVSSFLFNVIQNPEAQLEEDQDGDLDDSMLENQPSKKNTPSSNDALIES
eukprot:CAMPEP_0176396920 /NCGR_PEP_ID=MMETSP0126-20121128/44680_1 /TAXON_ID=141414 ORGANISM="Strombidinopsis acuminatum, Strain SPMC142" /NCGR_SAMPLE_ID=MMETSP0126 /ASSEMBLY_ACC=CAM_ASM_000229 /LENGTH=81 /DNA_ID=CAMNT_0017770859 /DNA_START=483 /DNA_END=728 /DNA_ORIENTATION=-